MEPKSNGGTGTSMLLVVAGLAALSPSIARADGDSARLEALDKQVEQLREEIASLQQARLPAASRDHDEMRLSLKNGRPKFSTADGRFSVSLRTLVQFDNAYYAQGHVPAGIDFSSGSNFRRARFGVDGTLFSVWSYEFIYDFGGPATEASGISSAFIQYDGLAPVHVRVGAFPPPESFEDSSSASDLLFLERAQPTDVARGIAGADGRDAASIFAYDDAYFAAVSYTGGVVGDSAIFDEQQALVGRAAYRLWHLGDSNFAFGADSTYVFKLPDLAAGSGSPHAFRLRERPELSVDSTNTRLIDTGTIDADRAWEWGAEAAGNWHNLYAQGGYFGFGASPRASVLPDVTFDGWYLQASWVVSGEAKPYRTDKGAYGLPDPAEPLTFDGAGWGAWELAARYSVLNLNDNQGLQGLPAPLGGVRGGLQRISTMGLNWYPNTAVRFLLDYQHTDVSRLNLAGGNIGANLDAVSLRAQLFL